MKTLKRNLIALALNSLSLAAVSQDSLQLRNGTPIFSKVIEISATEIKYKRTENMDGPVYILGKNDVQFIKYKNGTVDSFPIIKPWLMHVQPKVADKKSEEYIQPKLKIAQIGKNYSLGNTIYKLNEIQDIMLEKRNPEINEHIKKAKNFRAFRVGCLVGIPSAVLGNILLISSFDLLDVTHTMDPKLQNQGLGLLALSATCLTTSIVLHVKMRKHSKAATELYNQTY